MLQFSGFSETFAGNIYNYFSSYAHPTSASHLQTSQADYEGAMMLQKSMLKALFISSGLYLKNYSEEFPQLLGNFTDEDNDFILSWCEFGKELQK